MQEKEVFFTDNFYPKAKSIETKRFLFVIEKLIKDGEIKSFKSIAEKAGFSSQDFTDMKTGRKTLQLDFLDSISKISSANKQWILTGDGEILKNKPSEKKESIKDSYLDQFFEALERRDKQIDRLITLLEKKFDDFSNRDCENKKEAI